MLKHNIRGLRCITTPPSTEAQSVVPFRCVVAIFVAAAASEHFACHSLHRSLGSGTACCGGDGYPARAPVGAAITSVGVCDTVRWVPVGRLLV